MDTPDRQSATAAETRAGSAAQKHRRSLVVVLSLTAAYVLAEVIGGLITGSLALLADAGHTFTDVLGMGLALAAIWFARRPATPNRTYGFYRAEVLAALVNSILPFGIAAYIFYEAVQRFRDPPRVESGLMLGVAAIGLVVNLIGVRLLHGASGESLNMRGAFLEVLADLIGAVGVILAALVLLLTGWRYADPLVSIGIALFILPRAWSLLKNVLDVLLEATPKDLDLGGVQAAMATVSGVVAVHDVHAWTITSGFVAMSAHVETAERANGDILHDLQELLRSRFRVEHATLQVEAADHSGDSICCQVDPRCLVIGSTASGRQLGSPR